MKSLVLEQKLKIRKARLQSRNCSQKFTATELKIQTQAMDFTGM